MSDYPGLYRGLVHDRNDPQGRSRLRVVVPAVNGEAPLDWALPCVAVGSPLVLPAAGAPVWVAFEHGDPAAPVWLGTWRP